jgi:photosystem II stability/assembly factor-like uncharacterized protein
MIVVRWLLVVLVLFCALVCVQGQTPSWRVLGSSPIAIDRWDAMSWTHPDSGWIAGTSSGMFRTTDGGNHWIEVTSSYEPNGAKPYFRSLDMVSGGIGWAGSLGGPTYLLRTSDDGATWERTTVLQGTASKGICGIDAIDARTMVCVGAFAAGPYGAPHVTRTTDGGATYQTVDMSSLVSALVDVSFRDRSTGVIGGSVEGTGTIGHAVVLRSTDGGTSWVETYRSSRLGTQTWKFTRRSDGALIAAIQARGAAVPYFVVSTDDGITWTERNFDLGGDYKIPGFQAIGFSSPSHGWIGGRGMSFYGTTDGGQSWDYDSAGHNGVNRFQFFSETLGYASGLMVYKYSVGSSTDVHEVVNVRRSDDMSVRVDTDDLHVTFGIPVRPVHLTIYDMRGVQQHLGSVQCNADGSIHARHALPPGVYAAVALTSVDNITRLFTVSAGE